MQQSQASKGFIYFLLICMILAGASNTIVYKLQNSSTLNGKAFYHPFMQAVTMFVGEFSCIFLFLWFKTFKKDQYEQEVLEAKANQLETKMNYFWLIIPAAADFFTSNLQYIALNFINPSIYQMLRGGVILVTTLFTIFFLKKKLQLFNYIGCSLAVIGVGIVGLSNLVFKNSNDQKDTSKAAVAMGLILISLITNGILFVSEEKLFSKYYLHPFQVVGTEGFWGLVIYAIALPALSYAKCSLPTDACVNVGTDQSPDYRYEYPGLYFEQFASGILGFWIILGVFTIAAFNVCGVNITKHVSSLARSVVDVSRTVIVWIFGIILTVSSSNPNYQWENLNAGAIVVEAIGFVILVVGNCIYNKIIILPFARPKDENQMLLDNAQKQVSLQVETSKSKSESFHN
ncbi:nucleotide-sugar transporter, putative [Ichthyophthirius multifiliis]|uniref:Nucleotide-sugar transporter, putative n=1 Tax=Ichthyophthirius multifiliis TaxID=5932 RepID=G0QSQ1_ICHMU|nr:nucleotide-sugar transporter, putative [Ichthyophthirius multifiliis]EGR31767.1 nucleotide-sugar transporter, putative [Ichthyophthirius multifiliis]|eukprot:XP_004035253.1 nucleotide-sugar transporter, putative [Ichthyophthirius multifiliis]